MSGIESETWENARRWIELIFVKDDETFGGNPCAVRDTEFFRLAFAITQIPAADVDWSRGRVAQFNCVLKGRIGVSQNFVNDHPIQRDIINLAGGWSCRKRSNRNASIRQTALRNTWLLNGEIDAVNQIQIRIVKTQRLACTCQLKIHMVAAIAGVAIGLPFRPTVAGDE